MIGNENNWSPLEEADLPANVIRELNEHYPDLSIVRSWILDRFALQNSENNADVSEQIPKQQIIDWLQFQYENCEIPLFLRKWPRLQSLIFMDYSNKISGIAQRHCHICRSSEPISPDFISFCFPVRVRGISHQAARSKTLTSLTKAMEERLNGHTIFRGMSLRFCLALTFVLNKSRRDRDLDNMTKTMMDAIARVLKFNDAAVHHVDVVKLIFPDAEEYIYARLASSSLNAHNDVIGAYFNHSWAGQAPLDVDL